MQKPENSHSLRVKALLDMIVGFNPTASWNIKHWLPVSENNVQFVINKDNFHGVIMIKENPIDYNSFIVGHISFNDNEPITKVVKAEDLAIHIHFEIKAKLGQRAPQCTAKPNDATAQHSF